MKIVKILVALGPALASAVLVFAIEIAPALLKKRDSILLRTRVADRIQEYVLLMAGGASGIGAILGFVAGTSEYLISGLVASVCLMFLDISISYRRSVLEEQKPVKLVRIPFRPKPSVRNSATRGRRS